MKYYNCHDEVKAYEIKNITTELSQSVATGDKIICTEDWGKFKVRKNGRRWLVIGNETIRVTPLSK